MNKADRRFWTIISFAVVISAFVLIGLKIAMEVVITSNDLRKEELALSREMVKQLAELKNMVSQMQTNVPPRQAATEPLKPCDSKRAGNETKNFPPPGSQKVEGVTPGSNPLKGDVKAQVLLVEFSDFECPFSKKFYRETFPLIEKEYISTGKVKFAYRDYPLGFHKQAVPAAIVARCAGKSGKYWEIFDQLIKSKDLDMQSLSLCAKLVGMNKEQFDNCPLDSSFKREIKKDVDEGLKYGIQGTPVFFINGRMVMGAQPFEAFKQVIDEELNKTKDK